MFAQCYQSILALRSARFVDFFAPGRGRVKHAYLGLVGLLLLCALPVWAGTLVKVGGELHLGEGSVESVGHLNDGSIIVASESSQNVFVARYSPDGELIGQKVKVDIEEERFDRAPAIAVLNDGSFIVTWHSSEALLARHYDANLNPITAEFQVNEDYHRGASDPDISALKNGGFVIVWSSYNQDLEAYEAFGQRFSADGLKDGGELMVSQSTQHGTDNARVAGLEGGGFVVSWHRDPLNFEPVRDVYARRYLADGAPAGDEFIVNTNTEGQQSYPHIASLTGGGFVVVWSNFDNIYGQTFTADGTRAGQEFSVYDTPMESSVSRGRVIGLADGGVLVAWDFWPGSIFISAQRYSADGIKIGEQFSSSPLGGYTPRLASYGEETTLVWGRGNSQSNSTIHAQRYSINIPEPDVTLVGLPDSLYQGQNTALSVEVSGSEIYGIDARIQVSDANLLTPVASQYGDFFADSERAGMPSTVTEDKWQGALTLLAPAAAKTGTGEFASVDLSALAPGVVNLVLDATLVNQNGEVIATINRSYSLTIAQSVSVSGNLSSLGLAGDYSGVNVLLNGEALNIAPDGSFTIVTSPGLATLTVQAEGFLPFEQTLTLDAGTPVVDVGNIQAIGGDCNGDHVIDMDDMAILLAAYLSRREDGAPYTPAADFNRDSVIDIQDLTLLGSHFGLGSSS